MKIYWEVDIIVDTIKNLHCGLCDKKFEEGDNLRSFTSRALDKYSDKGDIFEVKSNHRIQDTPKIYLCEDCVQKGLKE